MSPFLPPLRYDRRRASGKRVFNHPGGEGKERRLIIKRKESMPGTECPDQDGQRAGEMGRTGGTPAGRSEGRVGNRHLHRDSR